MPRDIVDLVTIHENILPLGAVLSATVGKFPGVTPEEMLAEIMRHSRFTIEEFQMLATKQPFDAPRLHRRIRSMIEDSESFISRLPSDAVDVISMEGERAVQPDLNALDKYQRNPGAPSGFWPTSPEISRLCSNASGTQSLSPVRFLLKDTKSALREHRESHQHRRCALPRIRSNKFLLSRDFPRSEMQRIVSADKGWRCLR